MVLKNYEENVILGRDSWLTVVTRYLSDNCFVLYQPCTDTWWIVQS